MLQKGKISKRRAKFNQLIQPQLTLFCKGGEAHKSTAVHRCSIKFQAL